MRRTLVPLILILGLVGAACTVGSTQTDTAEPRAEFPTSEPTFASGPDAVVEVVRDVLPAVVNVVASSGQGEGEGTGFVVPRVEGIHITAGAWISSKWPQRAPEDVALLRAFLGGARDPDVLKKSDAELADMALADLTKILDIRGAPTLTRVYRWNRSSPQQEVGHADLMRQIETRLAGHPGLFVSAAGFRGVGIPDCVHSGQMAAEAALAHIHSVVHESYVP